MRYYSSTVGELTLQAGISGSDLTISVSSTSGLPVTFPYVLFLDYGSSSEEIVDVTAASGTTLTVTRGRDGTIAQAHAFGAKVRHGISGRDLKESRDHEAATAGVHGVAGSVVGTSDTQTLTNKTITGGTVNPTTLQKGGVTIPTPSEAAVLTNKDLSSATNTFPGSLATDAEVSSAVSTHAAVTATHGATGAVVGTTNTQTLTNKTISGASNTLSAIPESAVTNLPTDLSALSTRLDALEAAPSSAACSYGTGFAVAGAGPNPTVVKRGKLVTLQGKVLRSSGAGITAFTVPAGYRPGALYGGGDVAITALGWNAGSSEGPQFISELASSTGIVTLQNTSGSPAWSATTFIWVSGSWYTD